MLAGFASGFVAFGGGIRAPSRQHSVLEDRERFLELRRRGHIHFAEVDDVLRLADVLVGDQIVAPHVKERYVSVPRIFCHEGVVFVAIQPETGMPWLLTLEAA